LSEVATPAKNAAIHASIKPFHQYKLITKHVVTQKRVFLINKSTNKKYLSVAQGYLTTEKPLLFSKASVLDDIERHSHSSTCCHAVIGKRVICHDNGH
jgi:hypothetical protein